MSVPFKAQTFGEMLGLTLTSITGLERGSESVTLTSADGRAFRLYHSQDCCETVQVEDVCGDVSDLLGNPLLVCEEVTNENEHPPGVVLDYTPESFTWTFYKLSTIKGSVTIRWLGESNGYYSESVRFAEVDQ